MKKSIAIILILSICFCLAGCKVLAYKEAIGLLEQQNYKDAAVAFEALGNYKDCQDKLKECKYNLAVILLDLKPDPLSEGATMIASTVYESFASDEDINEAKALLEFVGDYEDSLIILEQVADLTVYREAIAAFEKGDFVNAKNAFNSVSETFEDKQKYQAAIKCLEKVVGTWENESGFLGEENESGNVALSVEMTIAPPFSIGYSSFGDCDWAVKGNIKIDVTQVWIGGGGKMANFAIHGEEIAHHLATDSVDELDAYIIIHNENFNNTIFASRYGAYSKIGATEYSSNKLQLWETPYSLDWTTYYGDGGSMFMVKSK